VGSGECGVQVNRFNRCSPAMTCDVSKSCKILLVSGLRGGCERCGNRVVATVMRLSRCLSAMFLLM